MIFLTLNPHVVSHGGKLVALAGCLSSVLMPAAINLTAQGDYQWRWAEDSSTRSFLLRGKELPLLGFSSMRSGWTIVQQQGPQLLDTAEVRRDVQATLGSAPMVGPECCSCLAQCSTSVFFMP